MTLSLVVDSSRAVERAATYPEQARELRITDSVTYATACEFLKAIKALRSEIADTFEPHIKRAHEAHRALLKEKADAEAPLIDAERIAKAALVTFEQEQERARRMEQARIEAELRRQDDERRLIEAIALEAAGEIAEATAVIDAPTAPVAVAVAPMTPKVAGISYRETWSARVTDMPALVQYVATHPSFAGCVIPNTAALNALARSLKAQMQIPGVEAICVRDVAAARR